MENTVNTVRNYFKKKVSNNEFSASTTTTVPQIGFKVSYYSDSATRELRVKVIGARQLPVEYGPVKPKGYLVKVTLYPQKEKFETKTVTSNWPTINEEFTYRLMMSSPMKKIDDPLKSKFISFTIYAVLCKEEDGIRPEEKSKGILKRYFSFNDTENSEIFDSKGSFKKKNTLRRSSYTPTTHNLSARRTIGAVTYNLERKAFTQKLANNIVSTPDIWRNILEISSGIQTQSRDGTKGSVELTLQYGISEDRTNDVVEVTVTKFRCSMQTMQEHEKVGGQLYIKITAFENEDLIQKMKSDKFDPTISLKLDPNSSTLRATVNKYNIEQVQILIRLMSKNIMGKKVLLGKIEIDSSSNFWKEIVATPSVPLTRMVNFE